MSDIFISLGLDLGKSLIAEKMRFTDYTRVESGDAPSGIRWGVSRVDDFALWGPAWDPISQTRVLIGGRLALEETEWAAAERLPYQGGLAARHILSLWLSRGGRGVVSYNGAALVAVIEESKGEVHLWTDRMGFFPAFALKNRWPIISSSPDLIAELCTIAGSPLKIDDVTIAEFLRTGMSTHPHTYWRDVRHMDAASHFRMKTSAKDVHFLALNQYWSPAYLDGEASASHEGFVETFAAALRDAGRRRSLNRLGRTALLLSSGADSRGMLLATSEPRDVDCYTYFDEPNLELAGAKKIAALAGSRHFSLRRSEDYYVSNAAETVRLSGGMWSIESGHHTGFIQTIRSQSDPGTLLTGCYCDYLFKGIALNTEAERLMGKPLPIQRLAAYEHEFHVPHTEIDAAWSAKVDARLTMRFPAVLQGASDARLIEFARVSPMCREADASGRLGLWRTAPFDVLVADTSILDVYGRMSVADKMSGIAFGQAIARVTGPQIAAIPNNNFGSPVGTSELGRVMTFLLSSTKRKLKRLTEGPELHDPNSVATTGSWPNLARVALKSARMRTWYDQIVTQRSSALIDYMHPSRRQWSFEQFATRDTFQLYRLVTAELWLRQGSSAQSAVDARI